MTQYLSIHPRIQKALDNNQPVLALESTIISHGMPYPQNVETALTLEKIARDNGAEPATIAIMEGKLKVGLTKKEIDILGKKGQDIAKVSRRDITQVVLQKGNGATTVSATIIIANLVGIKVFATGGIGGVHRGAEESFDISADLEELARTNVAVISAGAKAILDIGLTLEYLETKGVPVIGYQTDKMPAFYTRKSDFSLETRLDNTREIASTLKIKWDIGLKGGVLIANPIPLEYEMEYNHINNAIKKAIEELEAKKITGKKVTPFLLEKIVELTGGESLQANIKLVCHNVKIGAQIAKDLAELYQEEDKKMGFI